MPDNASEHGATGSVQQPDPATHAAAGGTAVRQAVREWAWTLLTAGILFVAIRSFFFEAFWIPSGSMENTLLTGDFVLVNKAIYGARIPFTPFRLPALARPARGDVVVFAPPHDVGHNYVKRLLGMPGDTVEMRDKSLYVNRRPVNEPYARHSDRRDVVPPGIGWQCRFTVRMVGPSGCRPSRDNWGPLVVPEGRYLVLGDNRDDSEDSRYWGFVRADAIRGRPMLVYYSFAPGDSQASWLTHVRWNRIGHVVN